MPKEFKHRFRMEAGLNHIARKGKGYDYDTFDYKQTRKEVKYGFVRGTFFRWWMNLDVFTACAIAQLRKIKNKVKTHKIKIKH